MVVSREAKEEAASVNPTDLRLIHMSILQVRTRVMKIENAITKGP